MNASRWIFGYCLAAWMAALASACSDDHTTLSTVEEPPDAGCIRSQEPSSYDVYFVVDVSGSMGPFLTDLQHELVSFASSFAEEDEEGRRVEIDYYVVGFVNDVKWFPENSPRMTSPVAVQAAIEEAVAAGRTNNNLHQPAFNGEPEENLLDALAAVIANQPDAEANLIIIATDANFPEAPYTLSLDLPVRSNYDTIRTELEATGARIHAFTLPNLDGLSRSYGGRPALTTLPGSTVHNLRDLTGARDDIRSTLQFIARESACN